MIGRRITSELQNLKLGPSVTDPGALTWSMRPTTTFVRTFTAAERQQLQAGLRSADAFTLRRCQILLASAAGQSPALIARNLGCTPRSVRNAIHAFSSEGLAC